MKYLHILITVCIFSLLLTSAGAAGLHSFDDAAVYQSQFTDVTEADWFESGVKSAYTKGLMTGVSESEFLPQGTVTWAQAITIAARINAIYTDSEIPAIDGAWYTPYHSYASENGFLPSTCPQESDIVTSYITRQELCGLFRNVLSDTDLVTINNAPIPDIDEVSEEFKTGVTDMYAAGIFTGKGNGIFDPNGVATRAEIATIVTRLSAPRRESAMTLKCQKS